MLCILAAMFIFCLWSLEVPVSDCPILEDANMLNGFMRVTPDDKEAEKLPTRVWLWQNGDVLNIQVDCVIDSTFTPGNICTRDRTNSADWLRVQLITIPDAYYSYMYYAYPTGNLVDGVRTATTADLGFNSTYSYTTKHTDKLWQVYYQIPLSELRFKQQLPYKWKIIITRNHQKINEAYNLPYVTGDMKNDYFGKAYDIVLSQPVKRKLGVSLRPYFVKSYDLINKTDSFDPDKIGVDVSLNPGQRTRIKLSMNPDFSDVPPDNAADNYNSKYPPYYMENRFFFTEDIDAFGVNNSFFYTRRIVQPRLAFKATGNTKRFNWGVLSAFDKEIIGDYGVVNRDDYFQVISLIPAWNKLRLANAVVSRMNDGYYNHVYCGNYRWDPIKDVTLTSLVSGSIRKKEVDGTESKTDGYFANAQFDTFPGEFHANAYYSLVSEDYSADAGYYILKNFQKYGGNISWDKDESKDYISYQGLSAWLEKFEYFAGRGTEQYVGADYYINLRPKYGLSLSTTIASEKDLLETNHDIWSARAKMFCDKLSAFSVSMSYERSKELVYDLYDTYSKDHYYLNVWGAATKSLSYDVSGEYNVKGYPRYNVVTIDTLSFPVVLDNRYAIVNGVLSYTPSQKVRLSGGLGLSTIESESVYANVNIYGNLRYEFRPDYFLYMGFKTNQWQDEKSAYSAPLGHFVKNSANAYVKISIKI